MALYPKSVEYDASQLKVLTQTYEQAYQQIYDEIATSTIFGATRRREILAQIKIILEDLAAQTQDFIDQAIPDAYKVGADQGVAQLKAIGAAVEIKTGFNKIHKEAIAALVDDTASSFGDSITGVNRSARALMSTATKDAITQKLATGQISGEALDRIKKQLMVVLKDQGLDALVDKGGKGWSLDTYTEMLVRTKTVESRNTGLKNRLIENGYDLVQVSSHGATDDCRQWEGEILSLTGQTPGYPTLQDAQAGGLFHPNCRHAINGLTIGLAEQTMSYDPESKQYTQGLIKQ